MQLYAYDDDTLTIASLASKQKNYRCPDCQGTLRLRSGSHRHPHFYHRNPTSRCRLGKKTPLHLTIQKAIQQSLSSNTIILEKRFDQINRIADIYDPSRCLVFEVQCSSITLQEARERIEDYGKLGIRVVWILHQQRFNRRRLGAAESHLRSLGAYFTNINVAGAGFVYDQFDVVRQSIRIYKGPPCKVDLSQCKELLQQDQEGLPEFYLSRIKNRFYFEKDLVDRWIRSPSQKEFILGLKKIEARSGIAKSEKPVTVFDRFKRIWRALFITLIETIGG